MQKRSFVLLNKYGRWPREWQRSIMTVEVHGTEVLKLRKKREVMNTGQQKMLKTTKKSKRKTENFYMI